MRLGRLVYRPSSPAFSGGTGRYFSAKCGRDTRHWSPDVPVIMASPGSAWTSPSRVFTVQAVGVNRTSTSRTILRADIRLGWALTNCEYPGRAVERNSGRAGELTSGTRGLRSE